MNKLFPLGLDIAMHGQPGYPQQAWTTHLGVKPKKSTSKYLCL